jgi:hypothetical protein
VGKGPATPMYVGPISAVSPFANHHRACVCAAYNSLMCFISAVVCVYVRGCVCAASHVQLNGARLSPSAGMSTTSSRHSITAESDSRPGRDRRASRAEGGMVASASLPCVAQDQSGVAPIMSPLRSADASVTSDASSVPCRRPPVSITHCDDGAYVIHHVPSASEQPRSAALQYQRYYWQQQQQVQEGQQAKRPHMQQPPSLRLDDVSDAIADDSSTALSASVARAPSFATTACVRGRQHDIADRRGAVCILGNDSLILVIV